MNPRSFWLALGRVLLLITLLSGCATKPPAAIPGADTVVYLVRHAEKEVTPGVVDPALTAAGQQRALALRDTLRKVRLSAIFSTRSTRTRATVAPLAKLKKLEIQPYDAKQLTALAAQIRRDYRSRSVAVSGHSNTVLETIVSLGVPRPLSAISDDEYSYLFEVHLPADSTKAATVRVRQYGKK